MGTDGAGDAFKSLGETYRINRELVGWQGERVYELPGYIKLGTGSNNGWIQTPKMDKLSSAPQTVVVSFDISLYDKSDAFSTKDTRRDRRLLLHKGEIAKISGKINRQGYTLVPLKLYFKDSLVKMEVALCRGKHTYDKKRSIAERDVKRATDRAVKSAGF